MKKVLAVVLCGLVLMAGIAGCQGCRPKEDPHQGLYGTYKMVSEENHGVEVYKGGERLLTGVPRDVAIYIEDLKAKAGDTITITKDTIKFSGGSIEAEFDYHFAFSDSIYFEETDFPFCDVEYATFDNVTPIIYQLVTKKVFIMDENYYEIYFYYLKAK